MLVDILVIFKDNFLKFDFIILLAAIINGIIFWNLRKDVNKIYNHFNRIDRVSNLPEKKRRRIEKATKDDEKLSTNDLLDSRAKMNRTYALYSNISTMFPLLGMLGTVWALIQMVNTIDTIDTSNFFSALTSTAWGIIAAMAFKLLDSFISYKIEDNEKNTEYLIFRE